jgi:hypothetical protein
MRCSALVRRDVRNECDEGEKATGGQPYQATGRSSGPVGKTLKDHGISKQQMSEWRMEKRHALSTEYERLQQRLAAVEQRLAALASELDRRNTPRPGKDAGLSG